MARPKMKADDRRDFVVSFRCSASEMADLSAKADKADQPINAFARAAALKSKIHVVQEHRLDFEARHQLRAIGNNLNQIARALNASGRLDTPRLEAALDALDSFFMEALPNGPASRR